MDPVLSDLKDELKEGYDGISRKLFKETDGVVDVAGNTLRNWFNTGKVPPHTLFVLLDMADMPRGSALRFHPWLKRYCTINERDMAELLD